MVGLQNEGNWVLPLLTVDFWREEGHIFSFAIPPEGEGVEIKSQGLPLEWHVQDTLFLGSARAVLSVKGRGKFWYRAICVITCCSSESKTFSRAYVKDGPSVWTR